MSVISSWIIISAANLLIQLVSGQSGPLPPRITSIAGAGLPQVRPQLVRLRRPEVPLRAQNVLTPTFTSRNSEDLKPVTEIADEDQPVSLLPNILREQQLAQAQQVQFQQAAAAFLNNDHQILNDLPTAHLLQHEEIQSPTISPTQTRIQTPLTQNSRTTFNDFGIGRFENSQRAGPERPTSTKANLDSSDTNGRNLQHRVAVSRIRPSPRHQDEIQTPVQIAVRARPKPIQPRPVDQNQVHDERDFQQQQQKRLKPVSQTVRKWREENDDGSITWGYENDDGSFKEEVIGVDCVTTGTYGYIDPDGNKREYHYETGIKCDPNNRDNNEDLKENSFINYDENKAVLPNGIEIDMAQLGKKKSRRPSVIYRN